MRASVTAATICLLLCLAACSGDEPPPRAGSHYSRVVTLAPNLTELVYSVGAGDALVGVSAYSDFPPAAQDLPIVGDAFMVDHERLARLQPDLLLVWQSGTPEHVVDELRRVGYTVEVVRTQSVQDIASALRRIGQLTGHVDSAENAAASFMADLDQVKARYAARAEISVFYQVSRRPLFTVNGDHFVSQLITMCGGRNVFADLNDLAPTVDVEAVVERNPEVMLASSDAGEEAFSEWERWPHVAANRYANQYVMPADAIARPTPRLVTAAESVCVALQTARERRAAMRQ